MQQLREKKKKSKIITETFMPCTYSLYDLGLS